MIDAVTEYWDRRPCNIRHSTKPVGSREYFEDVTKRRYRIEPHIPGFAQFDRWKGKRVLEIGCGIGTDGAEFARAGAFYSGIDASAVSLDIARRRFEVEGHSNAHLWVSDASGNDIAGNAPADGFDLIYSFGVLHHARSPQHILAQAHQSLAHNGELRIMLYAANSWKAAMIDGGLDQPEAQSGCPIARTYTPETVAQLLAPHFRVESIEQTHIFPWKVADYVEHRYVKEPWFDAMPEDVFQALQKRMGWHLLIVARPA